jgi:hypothetical protein
MADTNGTCFVISPLGQPGSEIRDRSDQILEYIIAPACAQAGYKAPVRADQIEESGYITSHVIDHLIKDEVVIADLSGPNANVFYELAIRHVVRKPFVQLMESGQKVPFDVAGLRTVEVSASSLKVAAEATKQLAHHLKAIRANPTALVQSPVTVALDLMALRTGNPEQRELARVLEGMESLTKSVAEIRAVVWARDMTNAWIRAAQADPIPRSPDPISPARTMTTITMKPESRPFFETVDKALRPSGVQSSNRPTDKKDKKS